MSALTKAALDAAISAMESGAPPTPLGAVLMAPVELWMLVDEWKAEFMCADRRKRRRMLRRRAKGRS